MHEWRRFRRDETQQMLLFVLAPLLAWIFCALYVNGSVVDLPVAVYDFDGSSLSRSLIRSIDATKSMNVTRATSVKALQQGIIRGDFAAGIIFPGSMITDVKASRHTAVKLYCNGTNYLATATISRAVQTIVRTFSAGVLRTRLTRSGLSTGQATTVVSPITIDLSYCYNPSMSYSNYLVPGLVFAQLGALLILSGALAFSRMRRYGIVTQLRKRNIASTGMVLTAKFVPYLSVTVALCLAILFILFPVYHIGSVDRAVRTLPCVLLFTVTSWWLGAAIGSITGQPMLAASISAGIGIPSFLFSGWTFPLSAAPDIYRAIASVLPFTHFMPLWFDSMLKNVSCTYHSIDAVILVCMAATGFVITCAITALQHRNTAGKRRSVQ